MAKGKVRVSQDYTLLCPQDTEALVVPVAHWDRYVTRIQKCTDYSNRFEACGWTLVGIGIGTLVAAAGFYFSVDFETVTARGQDGKAIASIANIGAIVTELGFIFGGLMATGIGAASVVYAFRHAKDKADLRAGIIDDMYAFSESCKRVPLIQGVQEQQSPNSQPAA